MKKLTSMFLALLMVMTMVPALVLSASAAGVVPSSAKEYNGHTYYLKKGSYSWTAAKKYCENKGGHLVTITSSKENKFVTSLVKKAGVQKVFMGAADDAKEGTWKWVTGEKFKYKAWGAYQPDGGTNQNYLCLWDDTYSWNDARNDEYGMQGFIIEWDMSKKAANAFRMKDTTASVYYGSTVTLKTLNASGKITWKTSNKKVATVSSKGVVKGVGLGSCTISATNGKKTVKCKVTVKDRASTASVSVKVNGGGYFIKGASTVKVSFKMKSYNCAKVTVYIKNSAGENVYKKTFSKLKKGTTYSFDWNGKNADGKYVAADSYRAQVVSGSKKSYSSYIAFKTKNEFAGGTGSKSNPFLVATTKQFKLVQKYPTGYFKQTKNLDFDYTAAGGFFTQDQPFNGVYDGGNKTINNLLNTTSVFTYVGEKGTIKNVKIVDGNFSTYGGLVRYNNGKITNCSVKGTMALAENIGNIYMGLICSENYGTITNCSADGVASATAHKYQAVAVVGGIAGYNKGKIISCSAKLDSTTAAPDNYWGGVYSGGIAGTNDSGGFIQNCEAEGSINGRSASGGIAGCNNGQVINSSYIGAQEIPVAGTGTGVVA